MVIQQRLQEFKEGKAREVAEMHNKTQESIENIVLRLKDVIHYEALCIINPNIKGSVQR